MRGNWVASLIMPVGLLCLFSACSIEQPSALVKGTSFDHQNFKTSCSDCHSNKLPASTALVPSGAITGLFQHSSDFGGTADCVNCHLSTPENIGVTWAGATYDHKDSSGNLITAGSTCSLCHSLERPSDTSGFAGLNSDAPFDYATHGGNMDCIQCHASGTSFKVASDWKGGFFTHNTSLATCANCHSTQRPSSSVEGFDHSTSGTGDCMQCHQSSLTTNFTSLADWAGAQAVPMANISDPSQNLAVNAFVPTFSGTTISSLSSQSLSLPQGILHDSSQITLALQADCGGCHQGAATGVYLPGLFHDSLPLHESVQPTVCVDCHVGTMPTGFVGPVDSDRSPASPAMKHDAVAWASTNGLWAPTQTSLVSTECSICHKQPTVAWSGATYHAALTTAGRAQPTSCLDCHANSRPTGSIAVNPSTGLANYNHSNGGLGDCVSCHTNTSVWSGGKFHLNSGTQSSCNSCHNSERPSNTSGFAGLNASAPFDYTSHGGNLDCVTCHSATTTFTALSNWQGGVFTHTGSLTSCIDCHSSQRPQSVVSGFDHSIAGTGDCIGCHRTSLTNNVFTSMSNWAGGMGGTPSDRVGSVTASMSAVQLHLTSGRVTSTSTVTDTILEQILHTSTQVTGTALACVDCHAQAGIGVYAGARFHNSLVANSKPAPTLCVDCHGGRAPADIVGPSIPASSVSPINHNAAFSSGGTVTSLIDCSTCHTTPGVTWGGAGLHMNIGGRTFASCTTCHYVNMPLTLGSKMLHTSQLVTQDCGSCHALPSAGQAANPNLTMWAGGLYHNNVGTQPTACTDCHMPQKPASITVSSIDSQHMNHSSPNVVANCATCHAGDLSSNPRAWSHSIQLHAYAPSVTTCTECHGLGNGSVTPGTGNDLPAGLTNSVTLTTSSVAAGGTYDQITHTDVNVGTKDCKVCHTQVGASGNKWKVGFFHINVPTLTMNNTTGRCDHCHTNVMPAVVVSGFNHASIGSTDCSSCHSYPGSGTTASPNWLGATGVNHSAFNSSTNCMNSGCHTTAEALAKAPGTYPSRRDGFTHRTTYGTNCAPCHTVVTGKVGVAWSGGFFGHLSNSLSAMTTAAANSAAPCSPCHDTREHRSGQNCMNSGCHINKVTYPTPSASGAFGGRWGSP